MFMLHLALQMLQQLCLRASSGEHALARLWGKLLE